MRTVLSILCVLFAVVAAVLSLGKISIPAFNIPLDLLLGYKLHFSFSASNLLDISVFTFCAAGLYYFGSKKASALGNELLIILLAALSLVSADWTTLFILAELVQLLLYYGITRDNDQQSQRLRLFAHLVSALTLICFATTSYYSFMSFGHVRLDTTVVRELLISNPKWYIHLCTWIVPSVYLMTKMTVAPFSWINRPIIGHFNGRLLALSQLVGFVFVTVWVRSYLVPILDLAATPFMASVLWTLLGIAAYQVVLLFGSSSLREMLYSFGGFLMSLYLYILMMHTEGYANSLKWGGVNYLLAITLMGMTVHYFEKKFGSSSFAVIERSSRYNRSMMRLLILIVMTMMAIPGSIGFVFMYSMLSQSLKTYLPMGIFVLILWMGSVFTLAGKMHRIILRAPMEEGPAGLSHSWRWILIGLFMSTFILGFYPNW